jgi:hypothetical protein
VVSITLEDGSETGSHALVVSQEKAYAEYFEIEHLALAPVEDKSKGDRCLRVDHCGSVRG